MWLYFELMICAKYRGKNTGRQSVNVSQGRSHMEHLKYKIEQYLEKLYF
jgi:hypothetical protein